MSTSSSNSPLELHEQAAPLAIQLCNQLRHQQAINTQTLDRIFHWFHLLRTVNPTQPPDAITYTTLLTNQLRSEHGVNAQTIDHLIRWVTLQHLNSTSLGNDVRNLDLAREQASNDIVDIRHTLSDIDATNQQNKTRLDCFYDTKDDIGRLWASIIILEGLNKDLKNEISTLRADLVLAQTTATRALKRAKRSHNVEPRDASPRAGPSRFTSPPSARTRSRARRSGSIISVRSTTRSPSIEVVSRPPTPYPADRKPVRSTPVPGPSR